MRNWGRYTKLCKILAPLPYICIFQCSLWSTLCSNLLIDWLQTKHDLSTPFGFSLSNSNTVKNKARQHPATLSRLATFQQIRVLALHLEILFQHCSIMRQTDPCQDAPYFQDLLVCLELHTAHISDVQLNSTQRSLNGCLLLQ